MPRMPGSSPAAGERWSRFHSQGLESRQEDEAGGRLFVAGYRKHLLRSTRALHEASVRRLRSRASPADAEKAAADGNSGASGRKAGLLNTSVRVQRR